MEIPISERDKAEGLHHQSTTLWDGSFQLPHKSTLMEVPISERDKAEGLTTKAPPYGAEVSRPPHPVLRYLISEI